jgi:hypothetical protein
MNKILATCVFVLACGFGATAMAQNADVSTTTTAATATTTDQNAALATTTDVAVGTRPVPAPGDRSCVRETGSHIPPPKGGCLPVTGNTYTHEELERTGQPDIGRALQQLDPSVQVTGH